MKLKSFGCSFIFGSDLATPDMAWPSLIAQQLDLPYETFAWPGVGNLYILDQLMNHADPDSICIVNWTFIDRFDYCAGTTEQWQTLRPVHDAEHAEYYFRNLHGQYRDMLTSLLYINSAIEFLRDRRIGFLMTCMDDLVFEPVMPSWHPDSATKWLQTKVSAEIQSYHGKNFLEWCRDNNWPISELQHPLEEAHMAAAQHWAPRMQALLTQHQALNIA